MPSNHRSGQRDTTEKNNLSLDDSLLDAWSELKEAPLPRLSDVLDRRTWHPDPEFQTSDVHGRPATRLILEDRPATWDPRPGSRYRFSMPRLKLAFADPQNTIHCVRRKQRREVLFAKRLNRGAGARRRHHWHSNIKC